MKKRPWKALISVVLLITLLLVLTVITVQPPRTPLPTPEELHQ